MTVNELKNMTVEIKGYTMLEDYYYGPDALHVKCKMSEALAIMRECAEDGMACCPDVFYRVTFLINAEDGTHMFSLGRELDDVCLGRDNELGLTKMMVEEALGIKYDKRDIKRYRNH